MQNKDKISIKAKQFFEKKTPERIRKKERKKQGQTVHRNEVKVGFKETDNQTNRHTDKQMN